MREVVGDCWDAPRRLTILARLTSCKAARKPMALQRIEGPHTTVRIPQIGTKMPWTEHTRKIPPTYDGSRNIPHLFPETMDIASISRVPKLGLVLFSCTSSAAVVLCLSSAGDH
jgi:hypothetical protein